jgi:formate dehydrogenase subunit gamma
MRLLLLVLAFMFAGGAFAQREDVKAQQQREVQQPGNNAPVWREVRKEGNAENYTSIKGRETNVLVQSAGNTWRQIRNGPVTFYGGWLVVLVCLIIAALYFGKGPVKLHDKPTGRRMNRFSTTEQIVHWSTAISFVVLGVSGLIMLFGKYVLLPLIGYTLFAWLTALGKNLHNFVAPFFMVSVLAMIVLFIRDNLPKAYDLRWFSRAWAFFMKGEHIPSGRFNAGEKAWFWIGVIGLSVVVSWSGLILLFPNFDQTRAVMQQAWIWHASAALLYIAISLGHIYMGTIGVEGSYQAMREGYVDETWAREHHQYWYEEQKSGSAAGAAGAVRRRSAHEGEIVKAILAALAGGLLIGSIAASHAKLPPAPAKSDAEKSAEAEKAAAAKAKDAELNNKAMDKAVANYKKNKGVSMDTGTKKK